MNLIEVWKDVEGYEGSYQVSNLGRVKSLTRTDPRGHKRREKFLREVVDCKGYEVVNFCRNGFAKMVKIHRLVAMAFIPNPENKPQVNHLNGSKRDNTVENLEWVTSSENVIHSLENGLRLPIKGSFVWNTKLTESKVLQIRQRLANGERSIVLADEYEVSQNIICNIKKRNTWKHI